MTRAIVFVKTGTEYEVHADRCLDYCQSRGYQFHGIIRDDWAAADRMMRDGETSVVLIPSETYLDPNRKPRIEVVGHNVRDLRPHLRARNARPAEGRRPRIIE